MIRVSLELKAGQGKKGARKGGMYIEIFCKFSAIKLIVGLLTRDRPEKRVSRV